MHINIHLWISCVLTYITIQMILFSLREGKVLYFFPIPHSLCIFTPWIYDNNIAFALPFLHFDAKLYLVCDKGSILTTTNPRHTCYIDHPKWCILLFKVMKCNNILFRSSNFTNKSSTSCSHIIEHKSVCVVGY